MTKGLPSLEPWAPHLITSLRNGGNSTAYMDFNRFRYQGVPRTDQIKMGEVTSAKRDNVAIRLFCALNEQEDASEANQFNVFTIARQHFVYCDEQGFDPLTKEAVVHQLRHNSLRQRRGEIKDLTELNRRTSLRTLLKWLNLPADDWLPAKATIGRTQTESVRGYSDTDLKKMLPLLRGLFKQLYRQFIQQPEKHLAANPRTQTMTFDWKGKQYPIAAGISKLFCAATYLMSYYTWCNSFVLYQLKRPHRVSHSLTNTWHQMPAFKRRSFKTLSVEIGSHDRLEIPKYALQFFDQLCNASALVDTQKQGLLLPAYRNGQAQVMCVSTLSGFKSSWLSKHFPMTDDRGERLWPVVRRFRATGGQLTLAHKGPMTAALLLDNTPQIVSSSYSSGNPHENDQMNRDISHTLEVVVRERKGISAAKETVRKAQQVEVLAYEALVQRLSPPRRSANGSYCRSIDKDQAQRFTTRARQRGLLGEGERLACADLKRCWKCEHQVLVESIQDLWCALSFRECLEESQFLHLDNDHHQKNFGETLKDIDDRLKLVSSKALRQAKRKLTEEGRHPLWFDASCVSLF